MPDESNQPDTPDPDPRPNLLWGRVVARSLVAGGVRTVVISPGSRSTPLVLACTREPVLECLPILDERSAAFFALGLARRGVDPVALICTSGSAAAHYLPAIIEAGESGVPLLILTADRPPEARDCASGQTIDQIKLFGGRVRHFAEIGLPESSSPALRYLRQALRRAIRTSRHPIPGPVHLNFPFRDPLVPLQGTARPDVPLPTALEQSFEQDFHEVGIEDPAINPAWFETERGLIVVGPRCREVDARNFSAAVIALAEQLGWPVLADASNPLRGHEGATGRVVAHYDVILRSPTAARRLQPECVLQVGPLPTSKVLRGWLENAPIACRFLTIDDLGRNLDPLHRQGWSSSAPPKALLAALASLKIQSSGHRFRDHWLEADACAARALTDAGLAAIAADTPVEPVWPAILRSTAPAGLQVLYASSMPVRDAEYFMPVDPATPAGTSSRGANGIDGTLSTALGAAHRARRPVALVTGDLAFLHDSNGLLGHRIFKGKLVVLLINNSGGGIFAHLPIAEWDPPFTEFFITPQKVDFALLCAAHGVPHEQARTPGALHQALTDAFADEGSSISVVEFVCDRATSVTARKRWLADAAAAVESDLQSPHTADSF